MTLNPLSSHETLPFFLLEQLFAKMEKLNLITLSVIYTGLADTVDNVHWTCLLFVIFCQLVSYTSANQGPEKVCQKRRDFLRQKGLSTFENICYLEGCILYRNKSYLIFSINKKITQKEKRERKKN